MKYNLHKPCADCPFRTDANMHKVLRPGHMKEIVQSLYDDASFPCHKTLEWVEHEAGNEHLNATANSSQCAGAVLFMEAHYPGVNALFRLLPVQHMQQRSVDVPLIPLTADIAADPDYAYRQLMAKAMLKKRCKL